MVPVTLATVVIAFLGAVDAKLIWSRTPASGGRLMRDAYPLGNGRMGAMPFGPPGQEKLNLNLDSLWNGGPFDASVCLARTTSSRGIYSDITCRGIMVEILQAQSHRLSIASDSEYFRREQVVSSRMIVTILKD
jgi:hypothetical protein